jgi:anti-sigma B factor antagonist
VFADAGVQRVFGGRYDPGAHSVTMRGRTVAILLGNAQRPALTVSVKGTAPSQHGQPGLSPGTQTTASATITNTGGHLKLLGLTHRVKDLLQITKLYTVFDVHEDEAHAVRSFA